MNKGRTAWGIIEKQTDRTRRFWSPPQRVGARVTTLAAVAAIGGCATLGPPTLREARMDYNAAVADTHLEELLINIVRVSKNEDPVFMEVQQINDVSTLNFNPSGAITGFWTKAGTAASLNGAATYTQTPTLQLSPLQGQQLIQQVATPITPDTIASLYNADWPILNILDFAANRITPGFDDQSAAINRIAALDSHGALNLASTLSDLSSKATATKTKTPSATATQGNANGQTQQVADSLSLYFTPRLSFAKAAKNSAASAMVRKLWSSLSGFYASEPQWNANRIELRTVPEAAKKKSSNDLSPVLSTRSAFGALKDALEGGASSLIGFVSYDEFREIQSSPLNNFKDVVKTNTLRGSCSSGLFYTLTIDQAIAKKRLCVQDFDRYPQAEKNCTDKTIDTFDKNITKLVEDVVIKNDGGQNGCVLSIMDLNKRNRGDDSTVIGAEELLDELREFILIIVGEAPPGDAFTAWRDGSQWYWIDHSDFISQRNLMLLSQFLRARLENHVC
jgi:hypothetical protein